MSALRRPIVWLSVGLLLTVGVLFLWSGAEQGERLPTGHPAASKGAVPPNVTGDRRAVSSLTGEEQNRGRDPVPDTGDALKPEPTTSAQQRLPFSLVDDGFVITRQAMAYARIDKQEAVQLQGHLTTMKTTFEEVVRSKMEVDGLRNNPGAGVYAFFIPSFPSEGREIRKEFTKRVIAVVGEERAALLLEAFDPTRCFGASGELETLLSFHQVEPQNRGAIRLEWRLRNPENNEIVRTVKGSYERFVESYGDAFSMHAE